MSAKKLGALFAIVLMLSAAVGGLVVKKSLAASATANATQTVIAAIAITKVTDLDFGSAPQGDPQKTVAPAAGASFSITGAPNTAYTITVPSDGTVTMANGGNTIAVDSFTSSPSATGTLDGAGAQTLRVGATRAALAGNQAVGSYTGTFTVTVVY